MNCKKVNFCLIITNIVAIISCTIFIYFRPELEYTTSLMIDVTKNLFQNSIIEFFMDNLTIIGQTVFMTIVLANVVSAFQNRKNRKLSFWQLALGVYILSFEISFLVPDKYYFVHKAINIMYYIVPVIIAIKNLICIKKNKTSKKRIVSYVLILLFNLILLAINIVNDFKYNIYIYLWIAIILVMQFVYTITQESSKNTFKRKLFNVLFYYVLIPTIVLCYMFLVIYSITTNRIEQSKLQNTTQNLIQDIYELNSRDEEYFIPVYDNGKFGFITSDGKQAIDLKYEAVSEFQEENINNKIYYFAIAKKDNNYYLISKDGKESLIEDKTIIDNCLYVTEEFYNEIQKALNVEQAKIYILNVISSILFGEESNVQSKEVLNKYETIKLDETTVEEYTDYSTYSYNNKNYSITIKPLADEEEFYTLCDVTIRQSNGNTYTNKEYIYSLILDEISLYSDGYIGFKTEDESKYGWYNDYGNRICVTTGNLQLEDVKNNIVIFQDEENNYYFYNMSGTQLLSTDYLIILKNGYVIKNNADKYVLLDENLNEISNEYENILL